MTHLHHHRIRQGIVATLTGALAVLVPWTIAPLTAHAAPECTETISGPNSGVLNVAADQRLCLQDAVQDGAVNVDPDGALSVVDSTITGAVTLKSGFSDFTFCGSKTVRGGHGRQGSRPRRGRRLRGQHHRRRGDLRRQPGRRAVGPELRR